MWSPPFCAGHAAFLFICLPGLSLVVSALFCWPCSISIHLSPRSLTAGVLFRWPCSISIHLSPRSVTAGVRPFPLAMQNFYSFVSQVCHCWCPPFSAGHAEFLFICFPGLSLVVSALFSSGHAAFLFICFPGLLLLVSALFRWPCGISIHLSPRSVTGGVRPLSAGHVAFLFICLRGLSLLVSALFRCLPVAFLFICLPALVTAGVRPCLRWP